LLLAYTGKINCKFKCFLNLQVPRKTVICFVLISENLQFASHGSVIAANWQAICVSLYISNAPPINYLFIYEQVTHLFSIVKSLLLQRMPFCFSFIIFGAFWFYRDLSKNKNKCDSETRPPNWWAQPNGLRTHLCFLSLLSPNGTPISIIYVHAFAGIQTIWNCFPSSPRSLSTTSRWIVR